MLRITTNMSASSSVIRHIVCSGGGVTGFSFYGMLRECHNRKLWKLEDIETIYGTSVGSIIAVILALDYDWDTLDDYLIKRPWNNVFKFNLYSIIDSLQQRGIFGMKTIEDTFVPLFSGKDISIDITMQDFYDITKKEIHIFTTDVMRFEVVDISYKTHPDWRLMDAVYASSAIPIIFSPFIKNSKCYCDGAMLLNYPLDKCIENGANSDEIIGLCNDMNAHDEDVFNESCSLLDYGLLIMKKLISAFLSVREHRIKNEFRIKSIRMSIYDVISTTTEIDNRIQLIQEGVDVITATFTSTDTT